MAKTYRPYQPKQQFLLAPDIRDWLPDGHLALFVNDAVDEMDLSEIADYYERSERGNPPYHPLMMTKVIVYSYCIGKPSSRKIEKGLYEDVGLRYLGAGNFPDFRTISDFRKIHISPLERLFQQVLEMCQEAGLVKLGVVSIDGTKVKANASMSENRDLKGLKKERRRLREIARELLRRAEEVDEEEDRLYGKDNRGDGLPEGFRTRKERKENIRKAIRELEEKKRKEKEEYEKMIVERKEKEELTGEKTRGPKPKKKELTAANDTKRNMTDPDSRIMKTSNGYIQGYNAQAAVDCSSQVIVGCYVTQECNDKHQLVPLIEKVKENTGRLPKKLTADAGYWSEELIESVHEDTELFIAPDNGWKVKKAQKGKPPPRGRIPKNLSLRDRMNRKLLTKRGKSTYKKRGETSEPVFGQIKEGRGLRSFLLRGNAKTNGEWSLMCMGHNILKLWRAMTAPG